MCDERERLIGYVYDECDGEDRALIDRHLETCATCREEIAGLRETRQDLLAWEVPDHGSVWRPFVPARLSPWWREVPGWAMAAAAGIMFIIGAGGSLAVHALAPHGVAAAPIASTMSVPPSAANADADAIKRAELVALQGQLEMMRAEWTQLGRRVNSVAERGAVPAGIVRVADAPQDIALASVNADMWKIINRMKQLETRLNQLEYVVNQSAGR